MELDWEKWLPWIAIPGFFLFMSILCLLIMFVPILLLIILTILSVLICGWFLKIIIIPELSHLGKQLNKRIKKQSQKIRASYKN